jgi:hypothetical protein
MPKPKKKLSKNAKAALKIVSESKLLTARKAVHEVNAAQEFNSSAVTPRSMTKAMKPRPNKKRG